MTATALVVAPREAVPFGDFFPFKATALALSACFAAPTLLLGHGFRLAAHERVAAAFVGVAAVSWCVHARAYAFAATPLALGAAALLVAIATRVAVQREPALRGMVVRLVLWTAAAVAVVALLESLGLRLPWSGVRRPESTLGNRNFVGAYVAVALPLAWWACARRPRPWTACAVILLAAVLALSRCRSAWIGGTAALAVVVGGRAGGRRGNFVALAACVSGVVLAASVPWMGLHWSEPSPLLSTLHRIAQYQQGSGAARLDQHRVAAAILRSSPLLGVGSHGWSDAASEHARAIAGAHAARWLGNLTPSSDLLRLATETGLLGLLLFGACLVILARGVARRVRTHAHDRPCAVAVGAALVAMGVHALFDAPLYRPETLGLAAVLVGTLPLDAPAVPSVRRLAGAGAVVVATAGTALACSLLLVVSNVLERDGSADALLRAQRWYARPAVQDALVRRLAVRGRCPEALDALESAMRWTPHVWGPLVAAERCASASRRDVLRARARAIEPDVDRLIGAPGIPSAEQADPWLKRAYESPYPVAVAPTGDWFAVERRSGDEFELSVVNLDGTVWRAIDRSTDPQLAPSLSPRGARLAFLRRDVHAAFRLHLMDTATASEIVVDAPPTDTAVTPMAWAPDGSRLAYASSSRGVTDLVAVDLRVTPPTARVLASIPLDAAFSWTPDGEAIASADGDEPAVARIVRASDRTPQRRFEVVPAGEVRDLAVSPDGARLAVTGRLPGRDWTDLYEVDGSTGEARVCLAMERDLERPAWLPDGRLTVRAVRPEETFTMAGDCVRFERVGAPGAVTIAQATVEAGGPLVGLVTTRHEPTKVASFDREGGTHPVPWNDPGPSLDRGCVEPCVESVAVPSPALLWRAEPVDGIRPAAVVVVHGGPHLRTSAAFDPATAWLVRSGIDVLALDYDGSRGHGWSFEQSGGLEERVADVAAAVDWVVGRLGVARERCIVFGSSYGADLVARASAEGRLGDAPIALVSLLRSGPVRAAVAWPRAMLAFHGAADPLAPLGAARSFLEQTFGADAVDGSWYDLPGEGHGLHRSASWETVFDGVRRLLDLDGEGYPQAERISMDCDGKCDTDRRGVAVDTVVIHATDIADWETSLQKLLHAPGRSAHYLVGRDGRVAQLLPESWTAWHAGNYEMNLRSIGVEHVGLVSEPFTEAEYEASARLVRYLTAKYGIARDRVHVIGHDQVPDPNLPGSYGGARHHLDPGASWGWDAYMARLGR
ncbi:MAG TPA: N-acetylmuramoyl-L-alanine amidase [Polyangiaceae bacterium]